MTSLAVALKNIDIFEREDLCGHVRAKEGEFRARLEGLRDLPIVGDVRGAGYFHAIELVNLDSNLHRLDDRRPNPWAVGWRYVLLRVGHA